MTIAVTGGGGRLGNVVVRRLTRRGERVRVLEPEPGSVRSLRGLDVETVAGSVLDPRAVDALLDGVDAVLHVAAKVDLSADRTGSIRAVNVEGTRVVAEACRARGLRLVHTSSHAALHRLPWSEPLDEGRPLALSDPCDYHRSKAEAERVVLELVERGLDATICNPGTLTGPFDFEPSMLGRALIDLFHGKVPVLLDAVTDYADVRDVADAMIRALERGERGERYLLTGEVLDMRGLTEALRRATGLRAPRAILPLWVGWAMLPATAALARLSGRPPLYSAGMLRASVSNDVVRHQKAAARLGYRPRDCAASLADAFAFYAEQGWLVPAR